VILLAAGTVYGVKMITEKQVQKQQEQQEQEIKLDDMISEEDPLELPPEPTPTPEPVVELTPEQKLDEIVNAGIEVMPLEDKVAGLFIVTPEAITEVSTAVKAGEGTQKALAEYAVGGIVYFEKNMKSEEQFKEMLENTEYYSKYPLFLAVDEEGGKVARLAKAGLVQGVGSAKEIAATGDAANAYQAGTTIGTYLADYGFNLNFAPVADISNVEKSALGDRAYGSDAVSVSAFVTNALLGLEEQGITGCLKHFPGIGSTKQDTHDGIAVTERTAEEFRAEEFTVFKAGIDAGADMIMAGHISAPGLTGDNTPCSLSNSVITGILREELGFDGVVITDALNMSAISEYYSADQAAVLALRAGCDMLLMPENFKEAYNGVLQAVQDGTISEERINDSLRRIYRIKYADKIEE